MSWLSDLFGGNKSSTQVQAQPLMPEWQRQLGGDLSAWVQKYLQDYQPGKPYSGQLTAPLAPLQQTGLNELNAFSQTPITGDLYGAAKGQVMDTLGGRYADPATSPFIQSTQRLAGQNLQDMINTSRGQAGARGNFFSRSAMQQESNLSERTQNFLNTILGDFMNQERGRQLSSVPMAQNLEQYGNLTAPLERIKGLETLGSLPNILEQSELEARYQDFTRQQSELGQVPGIGNDLFGRNVPYAFNQPTGEPSGLTSIMKVLGQLDFGGMSGGMGGAGGGVGGGYGRYLDGDYWKGDTAAGEFYKDPQFYMDALRLLSMAGA